MLAFPALQAGVLLLFTANCEVKLCWTFLSGKATTTVTHPFTPIAGMLQDDRLSSDDGGSAAEAANSAEFPESVPIHRRSCVI
jgi:hypothetical protein